MAFLLLLFLSSICSCQTLTAELNHVRDLTDKDFNTFTDSQHVRVVYFYDNKLDTKEDNRHEKTFLPAFDKSCKVLESYHVECAKSNESMIESRLDPFMYLDSHTHCDFTMWWKVDCSTYPVHDFCARPAIKKSVYTFRRGKELIELALDSMFDLDSIISNILQIVLLQEVPILQSITNRRHHEQKNIGKKDMVYSYHSVIGTYEHRIMMELAYAFKDKFKFALTTEVASIKDLPGYKPDENVGFWVLHCKEANDDKKPCSATKYRDSIDLLSLARFLHVIDVQPMLALPGSDHTIYEQKDMHIATIIAGKDSTDEIKMEIQAFLPKYRGYVGFLIVDKTKFDVANLGFKQDIETSTVGLKLRGETTWQLMPESEMPEAFLDSKLQATVRPHRDRMTPEMTVKEDDSVEDEDPLQEEDDEVAKTVLVVHGRTLDHTHVQRLTEETFTAQTQSTEGLVVMFYLVFDVRSKASLLSFLEASRLLAADSLFPLATVECHDERDLCASQNITSYPTIRVFRKGKKSFNYNGLRGAKEIYSFAKLLLADAPVKLNTFEEAKLFLDGKIPKGFDSVTDVSVLGLFKEHSDAERKAFRSAAKKLRGQYLLGELTGDAAEALAKTIPNKSQLPKVVVHKRNDEFRPIQVCPPFTESDKVAQCARDGALLMFPELTPNSFPKMYEESISFLILFTHGRDNDIYRTVGALSADVNVPNVNYCWMDLDANDGLAMKILMNYYDNHIPSTPSLNLVDYQKGRVYHYDKTSYERDVLAPWIEAVERGDVHPSKELAVGEWKPLLEGYNFLKLMDEGKKTEDMETSVTNEYGVGFDSDGNYLEKKATEDMSPDLEAAEKEIHDELLRLSRFYPKRGASHVDKTDNVHPEHTEL